MSDAYVCYDYRDYERPILHNLYNPNTYIHHLLYTTRHNLYKPNTHIHHSYTILHNLYNPNTHIHHVYKNLHNLYNGLCISDVYVC
jgi:succinate dehydrogenase/fumarate reductase flavoprotein subunit